MIEISFFKNLVFVTFILNLLSLIELLLLLYVNFKMNSYFENELNRIETVLDGCVMYKDEWKHID